MPLFVGVINEAIKQASYSTYKYKIGAVVFKGQRIIGSGYNGVRSNSIHPKYKTHINSLHAEQMALLNLDWDRLRGYSIFVARINNKGLFRLAKPCEMCQKLLLYVGIKKIYYTTDKGEIVFNQIEEKSA